MHVIDGIVADEGTNAPAEDNDRAETSRRNMMMIARLGRRVGKYFGYGRQLQSCLLWDHCSVLGLRFGSCFCRRFMLGDVGVGLFFGSCAFGSADCDFVTDL